MKEPWSKDSRILHLVDFRFKLRDGFDGNLADALREAADYLDEPTPKSSIPDKKQLKKDIWREFLRTIKSGGKLLAEGADIYAWKPVDNSWKRLNRGVL